MNINKKLENILIPFIAVFIALIIGGIIILLLKENPFEAYYYLFTGAFASQKAIARTLLEATPMIFTGLAVLFAFKGGLFNIGGQGQAVLAGIFSAGIGAYVTNKFVNNVFVVVIIAMCVGFLWAFIAGLLKAYLGVHEVISTIMLNYIATNIDGYSINYILKEGGLNGPSPQTPPVMEATRFIELMPATNEVLNFGFIIALISVVVVWFILEKTTLGYEIKAVGYNPTSSENGGINVKFIMAMTLGLS
ncbi:MAG: ABC transporter permease, partial [Fusobacteriaceae bacterium]